MRKRNMLTKFWWRNLLEKSRNFGDPLEDGKVTVEMNIIKFGSNFWIRIEIFAVVDDGGLCMISIMLSCSTTKLMCGWFTV
jgi:hypothetical protein